MTDPDVQEAVDRLVVEQRRLIRIGVACLVVVVAVIGFAPFYEGASTPARIAFLATWLAGMAVMLINTWIFDMPKFRLRRRKRQLPSRADMGPRPPPGRPEAR